MIEFWRTIQDANRFLQLSSLGRVRKIKSEFLRFNMSVMYSEIFEQLEPRLVNRPIGSFRVNVPHLDYLENSEKRVVPISVLMYEVFYGIYRLDHTQIFHRNMDELNNCLQDLRLIENGKKLELLQNLSSEISLAVDILQLRRKFKRIQTGITRYNSEGLIDRYYLSIGQFLKDQLSSPKRLNKLLTYGFPYFGNDFILVKGEGPSVIECIKPRQSPYQIDIPKLKNISVILKYNLNGKLANIYNGLDEIVTSVGQDEIRNFRQTRTPYYSKDAIWIIF